MRVSVLGIGTELTTGQIVNKNASWLSAKMKSHGVISNVHLVVPDEKKLILDALRFCADHSDIIFVTGGLGPTSDDFTRDVISEWTQQPLEFHEPSWIHVKDRLESRGFIVRDFQKQQCYYPRGSKVLMNPAGTANGFQIKFEESSMEKTLFILPGPPREIEEIWNLSIEPWVVAHTKDIDFFETQSWDTIGLGESEIAHLVEKEFENYQDIEIEKGYRVHLPYVEFKVSYFRSMRKNIQPLLDRLNDVLRTCTLTRNGDDVAKLLVERLQGFQSLLVIDDATKTHFLTRIQPYMRSFISNKQFIFTNETTEFQSFPRRHFESYSATIHLSSVGEFQVKVELQTQKDNIKSQIFETPMKSEYLKDRRPQYFAEVAMAWLIQELK